MEKHIYCCSYQEPLLRIFWADARIKEVRVVNVDDDSDWNFGKNYIDKIHVHETIATSEYNKRLKYKTKFYITYVIADTPEDAKAKAKKLFKKMVADMIDESIINGFVRE